jgi:tripartite-type tricarboxylate transporter receptor subunit TctC
MRRTGLSGRGAIACSLGRWIGSLVLMTAGFALLGHDQRAVAQGAAWPTRPIRLVVAYPPGGPVDTMARFLADPLGRALGTTVIVYNRPGAGGVIGSDYVAKSPVDGYTLLFGSTPLSIQQTLFKKLPYSVLRDFTPIAEFAEGPQVLIVGSEVPAHNVQELIDYAKKQGGKMAYASPSFGGTNHLAAEMLKLRGGFQATHVPYNGGAPAMMDVIGGRVTFMFGALTDSLEQVQGGHVRALGVTSKTRWPGAPSLPAISETLPGFEASSWYGVLGPANLPPAVVQKLNATIDQILRQPELKQHIAQMGLVATPLGSAEFGAYIKRNVDMWGGVIKAANIPPQ